LPARVVAIRDEGPDRVLVRLAIGDGTTALLSRITRRSRQALDLRDGSAVFAQLKAVAVLV
jgi:molybdate transport system ATP-binding protein